ncbi:hypothetical protein Glove_37g59 [Diversispora epigaea]|uniref:Protein kinase domain-containing protein n=1 Tax=Diversispora epigaea TaxID=1348612 RepID=A0A397JG96_9GLOM|nr:hypothetical protein Glove_37g59 [Diversispora epigaea]
MDEFQTEENDKIIFNSENIFVHNGNIKLNYFGILGTILLEISSGKPSSELDSNIDLLNNIVKGEREMIIPGIPSKYKEIYIDCWKHDENSRRPNISQVVKIFLKSLSPMQVLNLELPCHILIMAETKLLPLNWKSQIRKAFELYLKLAKEGYPVAGYDVGRCYSTGKGISKDEAKEFQWYIKSALAGNIFAMCNASFCYDYGTGVERDEGEAFKQYSRAAEKGHSLAQHNLGWCYKNGEGIEKNQAEANNGYIDSQYMVGKYFYEGCGTEKDIERGDSDANDLLKEIISVERDEGEAFKQYSRAAEKGHSLAQHNLGWCYKNGEGIEKNQAEANNGYIDSQYMVGKYFYEGCGTEKDIVKAICWRNERYSRTSTIPFYGKKSRTCKKITHLDSRYDTTVTGKLHDPVYGSTRKQFMGAKIQLPNILICVALRHKIDHFDAGKNYAITDTSDSDESKHTVAIKTTI